MNRGLVPAGLLAAGFAIGCPAPVAGPTDTHTDVHTDAPDGCMAETASGASAPDVDCDGVPAEEDCDDADPSLGAQADDNDCDGALSDEDCDDQDPSIRPGAEDTLGDAIDQDCDGLPAVDCSQATPSPVEFVRWPADEGLCDTGQPVTVRGFDATLSAVDLHGAFCICRVEGSVDLRNGRLRDLRGLGNLTHIGRGLRLSTLRELESLDGIDALESLEGPLLISLVPYIRDLEPLSRVRTLTGPVSIDRTGLIRLQGLSSLTTTPEIRIHDNRSLRELAGLESLHTIEGTLTLTENPKLTTLTGLAGLSEVGTIWITNNDALVDLKGLKQIPADLSESLHITHNASLTSIEGLDHVVSVGGRIVIGGSPLLESVEPLGALERVETISLFGLSKLETVDGLRALQVADGVTISENERLLHLRGLSGLRSTSALVITSNPSLTDLDGLQGLTRAPVTLTVGRNDALRSLYGLDNIEAVGTLRLTYNPALDDISALNALGAVSGDFLITDNPALPTASAEALRDNIGAENIGGSITILRNQP